MASATSAHTADDLDLTAHVVVQNPASDSPTVRGPFPTLTEARTFAYRTLNTIEERDIRFVPFHSIGGARYLPHQVAMATAIASDHATGNTDAAGPPQVVLATSDGIDIAYGPFEDAAAAVSWAQATEPPAGGSVTCITGADDQPLNLAYIGILDAIVRLEQVLRASLTQSHALALNDVAEPECTKCEYLPLIGLYGHICLAEYIEYPTP